MVCRKILPCYFTTRAAKRCDRLIDGCDELIAVAEGIDTSKAAPIGDALEQAETIMAIATPDAIRDEAATWRTESTQERLMIGYALYLGQASLCKTCPARAYMITPPQQQQAPPQ